MRGLVRRQVDMTCLALQPQLFAYRKRQLLLPGGGPLIQSSNELRDLQQQQHMKQRLVKQRFESVGWGGGTSTGMRVPAAAELLAGTEGDHRKAPFMKRRTPNINQKHSIAFQTRLF